MHLRQNKQKHSLDYSLHIGTHCFIVYYNNNYYDHKPLSFASVIAQQFINWKVTD